MFLIIQVEENLLCIHINKWLVKTFPKTRIQATTFYLTRLFQAKIVPVIDYASPIWSPGLSMALVHQLNVPQRIAGQAVIGAFRTVALVIAEAEAGLEPPVIRHHRQQLQSWLKWHTKPPNHWFWKVLSALDLASTRFISPLQKLAIKFRHLEDLSTLEKFEPYIQPPWLANISCNIPPRAEAILSAKNLTGPAIFTDSSARNRHVGIGIYSSNLTYFPVSSTTVASTNILNTFASELLAIDVALAQLILLSS